MEQAREKWDKKWGELGRMRLTGLDVKTAPDSAVAGLEARGKSRLSQMERCQVIITAGLNKALTGNR